MNRRKHVPWLLALSAALALAGTTCSKGPKTASKSEQSERILAEVSSLAQDTGLKVMLVGLDAADWQIARPLMEKGEMPNLRRLTESGVSANLGSDQIMLSPLLWTTVATGKPPDVHGIVDFTLVDPVSRKQAPMSASFRKSKALWNILTDVGKRSAFVAWWATWPAEPVNGYMVSDRVSYSLFDTISDAAIKGSGLTYPLEYYAEIKKNLIREADISNDELARFINLSPEQIGKLREANPGRQREMDAARLIGKFAKILAATRNYHRIGMDLLDRQEYDFFSVYYEAIDQVGHLFQHFMPPRMDAVSQEDFARFQDVVHRFYSYQDQLLGEIIGKAGENTAIIVMSDHGFKNGLGRPRTSLPYINENPAQWHRKYGVFVMSGHRVKQGRIDTVRLGDIAPTVLYLLGLPAGQDMPGKILSPAMQEAFVLAHPPMVVSSYEGIESRKIEIDPTHIEAIDREYLENLAALGYIDGAAVSPDLAREGEGGPAGAGGDSFETSANYHVNLATIHMRMKRFEEAEAELKKAFDKEPSLRVCYVISDLYNAMGSKGKAIAALLYLFQKFDGVEPERFTRLVALYLDAGQPAEAKAFFEDYKHKCRDRSQLLLAEARIDEHEKRPEKAIRLYKEILDKEPLQVGAMMRLYTLVEDRQRTEELIPYLRVGLELNNQIGVYHSYLGLIHSEAGRHRLAVRSMNQALQVDPEDVVFLVNMGKVLIKAMRFQDAARILTIASAKHPDDPNVWLNLGVVYGSIQANKEAVDALTKARSLGADSYRIDTGLILAHMQLGDIQKATQIAEQALERQPGNPVLTRLLADLRAKAR